jgi:hypothetical protein
MAMAGEDDGAIEADEQLALADGEERLPWLESDDDYEQPGVDTGRVVAFASVGLLAVVLIVGAIWWFTRDGTDEALVADGGVIEAPAAPYKTRPDDPGGRQVEGTGDTSFEVAEGETVEGRIAGSGSVPTPTIDREQSETPAAQATPSTGAVGVQVGAYSSRTAAEAGWSQLSGRIEALQGRNHRIVQGTADSGTIYRLQALAGSAGEADTLCRTIKSQGGDCQVKR